MLFEEGEFTFSWVFSESVSRFKHLITKLARERKSLKMNFHMFFCMAKILRIFLTFIALISSSWYLRQICSDFFIKLFYIWNHFRVYGMFDSCLDALMFWFLIFNIIQTIIKGEYLRLCDQKRESGTFLLLVFSRQEQ